jgi:ribosomal protein S18 acetylase RimI-like enzyme
MEIRGLTLDDVPDVLKIQEECYIPDLLETADTFIKKLRLFPQGSLGCWQREDLTAYVFAHPWKVGEIVPLDFALRSLPTDANSLYIHDLAVSPKFRGLKIADQLLQKLFSIAGSLGLEDFALVAVQNSEPFWNRYGFRTQEKLIYGTNTPASKMSMTKGRS